ncbi:MAG: helix-turn-helix transcriptional regulator [Oscillospiraceae bacterium]|nr:helix-turn-helix transcriptional regulator [Oscillospiraceae bacterium]
MSVSYKPLFKLLINRNIKKKDLAKTAGISIATITKMRVDDTVVNINVLEKICIALDCKFDDIIEIK